MWNRYSRRLSYPILLLSRIKMGLIRARLAVARIGKWLYGGYVWIVFALILLVCGSLIMLLRNPSPGRRIAAFGARTILRLAMVPHVAKGLDRLPARPHVLLVNHASFLDAVALVALLPSRPGYAFAVRQEFPIQRLLCPMLRSLGTVVLAHPHGIHGAHHTHNVERLARALRRGDNLVIFPEGGFRSAPGLMPFHSGAFAAAANADVPIAVAGLRGTRTALRSRTWLPRRVPVVLEIGPVFIDYGKEPSDLAQLSATARKAIASLSGEFDPFG